MSGQWQTELNIRHLLRPAVHCLTLVSGNSSITSGPIHLHLSLSLSHTHTHRYPPFFDEHPFRIYEKILEGKVDWPHHLSPTAKDLIKKLLVRDVTRRLGSLKVRVQSLKVKRETVARTEK